jgi:pilus assembly protein Flp/PilA
MNTFNQFLTDESGATAIEYGLIAALISVAIITAATTLGGGLANLFNGIGNKLNVAANSSSLTGS